MFPLAAIPFFILAGNLMETGGISRRVVEFAKSIVGGVQGGLPVLEPGRERPPQIGTAQLHAIDPRAAHRRFEPPPDRFDRIKEQVTTIQHGNWQQIDEPEIDGHQRDQIDQRRHEDEASADPH